MPTATTSKYKRPTPAEARKRDLAMIHLAAKQIGLSRDDYEHVLRVVTGCASASELDAGQREQLLKHFEKLGFKRRPPAAKRIAQKPGPAKAHRPLAMDEESRKVRALWLMLHELGVVRDPSEQALAAYVKRIAKVDALQWARGEGVYDVIESLKKWAMRFLPTLVRDMAVRVGTAIREGHIKLNPEAAQRLQEAVTLAQNRQTFDPMHAAWENLKAVLAQTHKETAHEH